VLARVYLMTLMVLGFGATLGRVGEPVEHGDDLAASHVAERLSQ
jgi:hypothetical protein